MANPLHSIKSKLLIFGLCISLIPIVIITNIYYFYASSVLKEQTFEWLKAVAESRKVHILAFIEEERDDVVAASNDVFIKNTLEVINNTEIFIDDAITNLNRHLSENKMSLDPSIVGIALLDTNGNVVASTNETWIGKDMSGQEAFEQAIGMDMDYGNTFTGQPQYSPELDTNIIFISVPIISKERGEKIGVIINAYDLTHVSDVTSVITKEVRTVDFSSDGFIKNNLDIINRGVSHSRDESIIALSEHLSNFNKPLDRHIAEVCIVDPKGMVVGCASGKMTGMDVSGNELFLQGLRTVSGRTYVGQPRYLPHFNTNGMPISTPVISGRSGEIMGVIIYTYYLATLSELTTNRAGMGETGELYLVNSDGMMLTESRFIEDTTLNKRVDTEPVRKAVEGGEEMTGIYPDYRGVSIVGTSMYLPEYGWTLLAEIDKSEAFAPLKTLGIVALVVGLVSGATVISVGFVFAFSASSSIRKLTDATMRIAGGDLRSDIKITSRDEIGQLANSFNTMVHSLKQAQEELVRKEKFATIGRISGSIAHDVRHPLATIKNSAYFLEMTLKDQSEKTQKHINLINSEVAHANEIITSLLRLSESKEPEKSKLNISEFAREFFTEFPLPKHKKLVTEYDNECPDILVDRSHLKLAFTNLVSNAEQAMPEDGTLTVMTKRAHPSASAESQEQEGDFVEISFADTGCGIRKDILDRIFEPFYTTGKKGIGLGLSIVNDIITANDGNISVESEEGKGSTFKIVFPAISPQSDTDKKNNESSHLL